MTQNILEMRDIDKGFNGVPSSKHVNLDVAPAKSHNAVAGARKSPHEGSLPSRAGVYHGAVRRCHLDGRKLFRSIKDSEALGIWHHPPGRLVCRSQNTQAQIKPGSAIDWHEVAERVLEGRQENVTAGRYARHWANSNSSSRR